MSEHCGNCGCGAHNNIDEKEIEKLIEEKKKNSRKFAVKYRVKLNNLECEAEEVIERIKAYAGIVDEVEFTEDELIISYDDRLITPAEISNLIN